MNSQYPFPKFTQWCVDNYSKTKRVIVNSTGSKVLCWIDVKTVRDSLGLSESIVIESERFTEEEINRIYRESTNEEKGQFLSNILKSS